MAAQWRLLSEYLGRASDDSVWLTWSELDEVVRGLPSSAIDHYPQWWHGDRPNTRAWRTASYEAVDIRPGISVRFVRSHDRNLAQATAEGSRRNRKPMLRSAMTQSADTPTRLNDLDPNSCVVVIPCSGSKRRGGRPGPPASTDAVLAAARRKVLDMPDSHTDESRVLPAWQRYDGSLYRAVGPEILADLAGSGRLIILSGGYGVLDGRDAIGHYNRLLKASDWPVGLLEATLALRAERPGMDVVAFAGATTQYAKVLRRTPWRVGGRTAHLVTIRDVRGVRAVSTALGLALRTFVCCGEVPVGTAVTRLA